jgi:RHS repeat-associated protein
MIKRVVGGQTVALAYDAENRLVKVCQDTSDDGICDVGETVIAQFTYDGDGKRVKSEMGSETILFIGSHYEFNDTTDEVTKYYFAGAQRIAMRQGTALYYLLPDHLGSTSLTTDASGHMLSQMRYKAWGEVRYNSGVTPTDYTYTGQYSNVPDFGLMFYNARWYDSYITQFSQPDSIIPDPYNPQDWNRYAYARNNPLKYTDPTGHDVDCGLGESGCQHKPKYHRPEKPEKSKYLGYNIWDWTPVVSDVRHIIRGTQQAETISILPSFMDEQAALQSWYNYCYGECHYSDFVDKVANTSIGGPMPKTPLVDAYSEGMGEAANGVVNILMTVAISGKVKSTYQIRPFTKPRPDWHLGLEYGKNMNIAHVGNATGKGVHFAFGSVAPYKADIHIYVHPNLYLWRPSWGFEFDIWPGPFGWRQ